MDGIADFFWPLLVLTAFGVVMYWVGEYFTYWKLRRIVRDAKVRKVRHPPDAP